MKKSSARSRAESTIGLCYSRNFRAGCHRSHGKVFRFRGIVVDPAIISVSLSLSLAGFVLALPFAAASSSRKLPSLSLPCICALLVTIGSDSTFLSSMCGKTGWSDLSSSHSRVGKVRRPCAGSLSSNDEHHRASITSMAHSDSFLPFVFSRTSAHRIQLSLVQLRPTVD